MLFYGTTIKNLNQQFEYYIKENLGVSVKVENSQQEKTLPILLTEKFNFYKCSFLENELLLVVSKIDKDISPAIISKQTKIIQNLVKMEVVFVAPTMTSYNRKRLIEHKVSFVVPNNQMYLPTLGMDLREHFRKSFTSNKKTISPATQVVILFLIYNQIENGISALSLSKILPYTPMTMCRSIDELENLNLGAVNYIGHNRIFTNYEKGLNLWHKVLPYLQSPIKKTVNLDVFPNTIKALPSGFSGLSKHTMISDSSHSTYAINQSQWEIIKSNTKLRILPATEMDSIQIEIWKYDPLLFSNEIVDPLSLYMCFQNVSDERTITARESLLEKIQW